MYEFDEKRNFIANGIVVHNSQESLRYVRIDDIGFWIPEALRGNQEAVNLVHDTIDFLENVQMKLGDIFQIDQMKSFHDKKQLTSAFRRLAPMGMSTTILVTGNLRAWRHIGEMRTSPQA